MPMFKGLRTTGFTPRKVRAKARSTPARRTVLQVEAMEDRTVPSTLIPLSNHRDLVYDPLRRLLDITSGGSVLQWNPGTQALTTLVNVGGILNGADISPDGSTLYFAQQQAPGAAGLLFALNLNTMQMVPAGYGPVSGEGAPWDIAVASNGKALFDAISTGTSPVPLRQLTLNSNAVTIRTDDPGSAGGGRIQPNTLIHRSADRSLLLVTEPNNPAGPFFTYNAAANAFGPRINLGVNLTNLMSAVNRNGTLMAFDTGNQVLVMDNNFGIRNQLGGLDGGVIFDPNQDVMYAVWPSGDQIVAFDTNTWAVKYQLPIGEPVGSAQAFGNGVMAVSSDSSMLFLATASGVRVFNLPAAAPAVQLAFSGFPPVTTAGTANTFTVAALDANGRVATGYTGTISFFSSDTRAVLPAKYTFTAADQGIHTFSAAFKTAGGNQYIAAQDVVTGSIQGGQGGITVNPGPVSQFAVSAPTTTQPAGYAISLTVAAEDAAGNIIVNYTGRVHFTSTDSAAQLPADYTFATSDGGVHTFSATPQTAGNQSFWVKDIANSAISGVATVPVAYYVPGLHFSVSASPTTDVAGAPFTVTVVALDTNNNVGTHYNGTVTFSAVAGSVLPANYTFTAADNGAHTFTNGVTLFKAGNQTITVRDVTFVTGGPAGSGSGTVTITPAAASALNVGGFPSPVTAGTTGTLTVTAKDAYGNVATGYAGTVHISSSDAQGALPTDYTFTATDQGVHSLTATLKTAGSQSLTATDTANGSLTASQSAITVNPAAVSALRVSGYPSPVAAGTSKNFTIGAVDAYGNVVPTFSDSIQVSSSDGQAQVSYSPTLTNGTETASAVFKTAGSQSLTARDSFNSAISGSQSGIVVNPGPATTLLITGFPSSATADVPVTFTVTAQDAYGNVATNYAGPVHFYASDWRTVVPADSPLSNGTGTFSIKFRTVGTQSFSVWDAATGNPVAQQNGIAVNPGPAAGILANAGTTVTAGTSLAVTITAIDSAGNTAPSYRGTIHFNSSDPQATLPADYTFTAADNGVHTFTAVLRTAGAQYIAAWDNGSFSWSIGTQANYTVNPAAASQLVLSGYPSATTAGTANNFTVTARDAYGNTATGYTGTVSFSSNDPQAALPAAYSFTTADAGMHTFSASETGISVTAAAAAQFLISAPSTAQAGVAFNLTLTVVDAYGNVVTGYTGTVHFSSSDQQAGLPADYTFGSGDAGMHTFSVILQTPGTQTITITDTLTGSLTASTQVSL